MEMQLQWWIFPIIFSVIGACHGSQLLFVDQTEVHNKLIWASGWITATIFFVLGHYT